MTSTVGETRPPLSFAARIRSWGRGRQTAALIGVLMLVLLTVNEFAQSIVPDRRGTVGPGGSSFATSGSGLAAWASLLEQSGMEVSQRRESLGEGQPLDPSTTLVVLAGDRLLDDDVSAVQRFLSEGGRLVTDATGPLAPKLFDVPPVTSDAAGDPLAETAALVPLTDPFTTRGASALPVGSILIEPDSLPSGATTVFARGSEVLVAEVTPLAGGTVILLANSTFLSNEGLATGDSAAYALALGASRPVVFGEEHHGYGSSERFGGLPVRWRWSVVLFIMAGLAAMWSQGRRNGPPEPPTRDLPPPRRRTIDVVATSIVRSWSANGGAPIESSTPTPKEASV